MQFSATYRKQQLYVSQKFLFLLTKKDSENKKLPSNQTLFASLMFSLLHSISICPIFANTLFKNHNILHKQFGFYLSYIYFFLSNQHQAYSLKIAYIFKVFWAQSCLMVAQQFHQITYVCNKCNNFQDSKQILMISDFKNFPIMLLKQLNCGLPKKKHHSYFSGILILTSSYFQF